MVTDRPLEIVDDKDPDWHAGFFSSNTEFAKGKELADVTQLGQLLDFWPAARPREQTNP